MQQNDGIKSDQGYPYNILAVGGADYNSPGDVQKFFHTPSPPEPQTIKVDMDGDGIEEEIPLNLHDDGMYVDPATLKVDIDGDGIPEEIKPIEMPMRGPAYLTGDDAAFNDCVDFAKENGLNAVLVKAMPIEGNIMYDVDYLPTVIYLDKDGNEVQPEGAPTYSPFQSTTTFDSDKFDAMFDSAREMKAQTGNGTLSTPGQIYNDSIQAQYKDYLENGCPKNLCNIVEGSKYDVETQNSDPSANLEIPGRDEAIQEAARKMFEPVGR